MKKRHHIIVPSKTYGWGESKRTDPALDCWIEVNLDEEAIAQHFGAKAARSKGKRATQLAGMLKVKVISSKEVS